MTPDLTAYLDTLRGTSEYLRGLADAYEIAVRHREATALACSAAAEIRHVIDAEHARLSPPRQLARGPRSAWSIPK